MADDLTIEILKQIRDNTAQTTQRLERVEERLERMDGRLGSMDERLGSMDGRLGSMDQRLGSMDQRLGRVENGLSDLGKFMRQIALDLTKQERALRPEGNEHVKVLEKDVSNLKSRMSKLEKKKGA